MGGQAHRPLPLGKAGSVCLASSVIERTQVLGEPGGLGRYKQRKVRLKRTVSIAANRVQKESCFMGSQRKGNWDMTEKERLLGSQVGIQTVPLDGQTGSHDWRAVGDTRGEDGTIRERSDGQLRNLDFDMRQWAQGRGFRNKPLSAIAEEGSATNKSEIGREASQEVATQPHEQ